MKNKLILFAGITAILSSCSSAYRLGQTPDDVYYSPAPPQNEYVTLNNQQDQDSYGYNNDYSNNNLTFNNDYYPSYPGDLSFSLGYGYNPYAYNYYGSPFFTPYNSFYSPYSPVISFYPYYNNYNSFYSPYYSSLYYPAYGIYNTSVVYNSKPPSAVSNYSGPRQYNLSAYNRFNNTINTPASQTVNADPMPVRTVNTAQRSNSRGVGNFIRRVFTPSGGSRNFNIPESRTNNFNNNNNYTPSRSFQPGGSNSGSGGSSSGGSAPVRTFRR